MGRVALAAAVLAAALALPAGALAKSYSLPTANVAVVVRPDGTLDVTEQITFAFSGPYSGAFRAVGPGAA
jgi:hypothetical protein